MFYLILCVSVPLWSTLEHFPIISNGDARPNGVSILQAQALEDRHVVGVVGAEDAAADEEVDQDEGHVELEVVALAHPRTGVAWAAA